MISFLISLTFFINSLAWAQDKCPDEVQVLQKGQIANCSGLLFSPEASKKVDQAQEDRDYYKSLTDKYQERQNLYTKEVNLLEQRLTLYMDQHIKLYDELEKTKSSSKWEKVLYFGLGVLVTGLAVDGASKLGK